MTAFQRSLPTHPDLDQQKKQARELLRAFRDSDGEAVARIRAQLPDKEPILLADAQFVLAREYGFASWVALKEHIEEVRARTRAPEELMGIAIQKRDARAVRKLLERHAELRDRLNDPVFSFDTPAIVHFAGDKDPSILKVLLEFGADPNRRSDWHAGPFHALHSASPAAAEVLLAAGATPDACAAAHLDRLDLLKQIITEDPARVHERGGDGQTPLHFARSREVVDLLLDAGADINARDVDHHASPAQWMLASRRGAGRYELARYLVERGAETDIFLAAALGMNDRVRAMLQADPALLDLCTTKGEYDEQAPNSYHIYMWTIGANLSPLQVAAQFGHSDTLEILRGFASPRQRLLTALAQGDAAETHALLHAQPKLLGSLTAEDRRVLPEAAWAGNTKAVALMMELGFDPFTPDVNGATALHCAAFEGSAECVRIILRHAAAAKLVQQVEPQYGGTPLGWCLYGSCHGPTAHDHLGVVRLLLGAGADPNEDLSGASDAVNALVEDWRRR